jgi:hypothetical protein
MLMELAAIMGRTETDAHFFFIVLSILYYLSVLPIQVFILNSGGT